MYEITTGWTKNCEGVRRRDFLRIGGTTAFGLSLPGLLRLREARAADTKKDVSCILLWMDGGPTHLDTFDPKPEAPVEITGGMKAISTNVPGIQLSEWLPQLATVQDKFSIVRSLTSPDASHGTANHYLLTGYKFTPFISYPTYSSVVAHERGLNTPQGLPSTVWMGGFPLNNGGGTFSGYLSAAYNPFNVGGDPNSKSFNVKDVTPPSGVDLTRVERRRGILDAVDRFQRDTEARVQSVKPIDKYYESAFSLVTSPAAKKAFDLSQEPDKLRDEYGRNTFGQSCLLARRLVESGVRFVTIVRGGWDTHTDNFKSLKDNLLPEIDKAYASLLRDLHQHGMLDSTLVMWMGEFGRTPKVNTSAGRDHWSESLVATIGGGGLKNGVAVGSSNAYAEHPEDKPYRIEDLAATVYHSLGIDRGKELQSADGRPHLVNYDGTPIAELT